MTARIRVPGLRPHLEDVARENDGRTETRSSVNMQPPRLNNGAGS